MSEVASSQFQCQGCGKSYRWKPELAGRRVKCKCGQVTTVPKAIAEPDEEELYDLAPSADDDPVRIAFAAARRDAAVAAEVANLAPPPPEPAPRTPTSPMLGYQRAPSQREKERAPGGSAVLDMTRDVYVSVALLLLGLAVYVAYYAVRGELGGRGIAMLTIGLTFMTAFKAALLVGFAFVIAGPLGVSFGGIWTAILKLAAIAIFTDGAVTWIDAAAVKLGGPALSSGIFGYGVLSFPAALGIYWLLMIYLFSMDAGDSWLVVILLSVFDWIVRLVLVGILLKIVLGWGGFAPAAMPIAALGGSAAVATDEMTEHITELQALNLLKEAKEYISGGRQSALLKPTEAWYAAGCKNVWFEVTRDFNGKVSPVQLIVELPKDKVKDKEQRAKCYEILKGYYEGNNLPHDPAEFTDTGERYIVVPMQ